MLNNYNKILHGRVQMYKRKLQQKTIAGPRAGLPTHSAEQGPGYFSCPKGGVALYVEDSMPHMLRQERMSHEKTHYGHSDRSSGA